MINRSAELRAELESVKAHLCPCGVPYLNCAEHEEVAEDAESTEA